MNSKEAKVHIIDTINGDMNKEYFINEILPEIEKDLEVLEMLGKYIYYSNKSSCIRMKDIYKRTTNFDYEDLKEWLENENKGTKNI